MAMAGLYILSNALTHNNLGSNIVRNLKGTSEIGIVFGI